MSIRPSPIRTSYNPWLTEYNRQLQKSIQKALEKQDPGTPGDVISESDAASLRKQLDELARQVKSENAESEKREELEAQKVEKLTNALKEETDERRQFGDLFTSNLKKEIKNRSDNYEEKYFSEGCSQFIVSRTSTAPQQAAKRATACAAEHGTSCVLSTEVGLSIPAVFLFRVDRMVILIAPRVVSVAKENEEVHVRVSDPSKDGIFGTKTVLMNYSIEIEYLDGDSRGLVSETIHDDEAFCVQLLRGAYVDDCWEKLD